MGVAMLMHADWAPLGVDVLWEEVLGGEVLGGDALGEEVL